MTDKLPPYHGIWIVSGTDVQFDNFIKAYIPYIPARPATYPRLRAHWLDPRGQLVKLQANSPDMNTVCFLARWSNGMSTAQCYDFIAQILIWQNKRNTSMLTFLTTPELEIKVPLA